MEIKWVDQIHIHTFEVEHQEIPRSERKPYYLNSSTLIGVLHTTEGTTVESAWNTLSRKSIAPHFIAGQQRIVQSVPRRTLAAQAHG